MTVLKWPGGKHYLAPKIVALMPPHTHYVEPYFGGGAVLLAKDPEGISEVVNDLNGALMNFWRCLQDPIDFARMYQRLMVTPFSEVEWGRAELGRISYVNRAIAFFIRCRQSLAGRMQSFAPLSRTRTRRGMNEQVSAWLTAIEGLPAVHERLKRVVIYNQPALETIRQEDAPDTLFYLDPPYLHETRTTMEEYGAYEMTEADHRELLEVISRCKGKVMISGYHSLLYDGQLFMLDNWTCHEFDLPNNAAGGKRKQRRTECLWCNF